MCPSRLYGEIIGRIIENVGEKTDAVFITGAGAGLGREMALAFASEGYAVAVTGIEGVEGTAAEIRARGGRALGLPLDLRHSEQVEEAVNAALARFRGIGVLINNAAIAPAASFLEMPDSLWDDVVRINLTGTYNCCKVFLPQMIRGRWGRVINIASTAAKVVYPHVSAYVSSKHGILGLTRSLALESAKWGVTVNAICPGYLDTDLTRKSAESMARRIGKTPTEVLAMFAGTSPQGRLIGAEEVASLALLLASENSGGLTGQAINVDGGAVMA